MVAALRAALVGVGNVAVNGHLPGWKETPEVQLVAAADVRAAGREPVQAAFPEARWYESHEELLAKELSGGGVGAGRRITDSPGAEQQIDLVDIATPPRHHGPAIRASLERGLHVLCEKPLVLDLEELESLARLARERERVLFTVHNWKHAPQIKTATGMLRSRAIGTIRRCEWEVHRTQPAVTAGDGENWRVDPALSGGGILVDHGWHALYVLTSWMGAPKRLRATLETRKHTGWPLEDTVTLDLEYAQATAHVFLTWAAEERSNTVRLKGPGGSICVAGRTVMLHRPEHMAERIEFPSGLAHGSHHPDWFGGVAKELLAEIQDPALRYTNLAEATVCLKAIHLAKESSAANGEWRSL